jgi:dynamin 1-like protein
MVEARRAEGAFFTQHPDYSDLAGQCGVGHLARRLNVILVEHIRVMLPNLRWAHAWAGARARVSLCVNVEWGIEGRRTGDCGVAVWC